MQNLFELFNNCHFKSKFNDFTILTDVLNNLPSNFKYTYEYGKTRLAIIPNDSFYVIKIPFQGEYDDNDGYWTDFYVNNDSTYHWDHCLTEILIYREAKKYNINKIFVPLKQIGIIKDTENIPIYIQQKVHVLADINDIDHTLPIPPHIQNMYDIQYSYNLNHIDPYWLYDALQTYGYSTFDKLLAFLSTHDITDLHRANLGYTYRHNLPVILDYGGYNP